MSKCSVGRHLRLENCFKKVRTPKKWRDIEHIEALSQDQQDLLLFRTGLKKEDITSICPYHQQYFYVNNPNYFYGKQKHCCNPFELHGPHKKGAFTKITLTLARQVNIEPKLKPGNVLCHQCRTHIKTLQTCERLNKDKECKTYTEDKSRDTIEIPRDEKRKDIQNHEHFHNSTYNSNKKSKSNERKSFQPSKKSKVRNEERSKERNMSPVRKSRRLSGKNETKIAERLDESRKQFKLEQKARYDLRKTEWSQLLDEKHLIANDNGELLSYNMHGDPTEEQLKERDGDALSAQVAYAVDSGLGRMKDASSLHNVLDNIREKGNDTSSNLPQEYQSLTKEIKKENNPENLQRIVHSFKKKIDRQAKLLACAACGMRHFNMGSNRFSETKISHLKVLKYTEKEMASFTTANKETRLATSVFVHNNDHYHLLPQFVNLNENAEWSEPTATLCSDCYSDVGKGIRGKGAKPRRPKYSIANGIDYGQIENSDLPPLSLAEQIVLSPAQEIANIIKIKGFQSQERQSSLVGNIITYKKPNDVLFKELNEMNSETMTFPRPEAIDDTLSVVIIGSKLSHASLIPTTKKTKSIQVNPQKIYKWCEIKKKIDPLWANVLIDKSPEMTKRLENIPGNLIDSAEYIDDEKTIEVEELIEKMRKPPTITVEMNSKKQNDVAEDEKECKEEDSVFITHAYPPADEQHAAEKTLLKSVEMAVTQQTDEHNDSDNETSFSSSENHKITFRRPKTRDAFNEFEENALLFYSAFPHVFLFGRGLQDKGSIPKAAVRNLLLQYDGRAANCVRLVFLLFNQQQRHAAAKAIAAAVKMQPAAFQQFGEWVADESFVHQLRAAQQDPLSQESKKLISKVMKHLAMVKKKIPYTVAARKGAMSHLYALVYHFGLPSVYFTFSPDDTFTTLNIRLSYAQTNNIDFPAEENGLSEALKKGESEISGMKITSEALRTMLATGNGAVAAAEIFSLIVDAVFTDLLGMPPSAKTKKTVPLPGRFHGVFGSVTSAFGVTENQDRGSLHMHLVMWGALPAQLLQAAGGIPFIVPVIAEAMEYISSCELDPLAHLKNIFDIVDGKSRSRPTLFEAHDPIKDEKEFQMDVDRVISSCNIHQHAQTCHKPPNEKCRMGLPRPIVPNTRCVQIIPAPTTPEHPEKYIVLPEIELPEEETLENRNLHVHPVPKRDDRILIWEQKRPDILVPLCTEEKTGKVAGVDFLNLPEDLQKEYDSLPPKIRERINRALEKRNGLVVEHNKTAAVTLGCNTDASLLGSESQAKLALCYILVYMVKPSAPLAKSVSLILNARQDIEHNPSIAKDSGTPKRTAMHLLNKVVNNISGLQEISAQTAAASILGMPAETCTHEFHLLFVDAALKYVNDIYEAMGNEDKEYTRKLSEEEEFGTGTTNQQRKNVHHFETEGMTDDLTEPELLFESGTTEPSAMGIEDDLDDCIESEPYSTAPVYKTAKGKIAVHQVVHYRYRGPELFNYNMDDYAALINIIPKKEDNDTYKPGRQKNATYRFHHDHPLFESHVQQVRSKPHIPIFIGRPPKPPGPRPLHLTASWKKKARRFASYILILLKPWRESDGRLPTSLTWAEMCRFVTELRDGPNGKGQTFLGRITLSMFVNIGQGLRINNDELAASQDYRCREATVLNRPDVTSALPKRTGKGFDEEELSFGGPNRDGKRNEKEQTASDEAFAIISRLQNQANVDDIVDPSTLKTMKYLTNTASALNDIFAEMGLTIDDETAPEVGSAPALQEWNKNDITNSGKHPVIYNSSGKEHEIETLRKNLRKEPKIENNNAEDKIEPSLKHGKVSTTSKNKDVEEMNDDEDADSPTNKKSLSASLNSEQYKIWAIFDRYFAALSHSKASGKSRPKPPRIFIHGGPGTGKTFLINAIHESLKNHGFSLSSCALTGVASGSLPDKRTMHSTFGFKIERKRKENCEDLVELNDTELINLRARFELESLELFVIDELSTIGGKFLAKINKAACQLLDQPESTDFEDCFGGKAVLLCGDMFQFPPVIPRTPLYTSVVNCFLSEKNSARQQAIKKRLATSLEMMGAKLFVQFQKMELTQQMRAAGDQEHMRLLNEMRQAQPNMDWVVNQLEKTYPILSSTLIKEDPEFLFSPIATTGNKEKAIINECVSKAFAIYHKQQRFVWMQPIRATGVTLSRNSVDAIYKREPLFKSYFVSGAPAILTQNICCKRNLANGTAVTYHSLILDPEEDDRYIKDRIERAQPGEDIYLRYPPQYINVSVDDRDVKEFEGLSLIDGEVVIPIGRGFKGNKMKTYVKENASLTEITSTCHDVEIRFAITLHKVEGKTVKRLCADINDHTFLPHINFHGLFVAISRVRNKKHFARLPYQPDQSNLQHLRNLKPPKTLLTWLHAYDENGFFNHKLLKTDKASGLKREIGSTQKLSATKSKRK